MPVPGAQTQLDGDARPHRAPDQLGQARDEGVRPGSTAEQLGGLKPAFRSDGTITPGNASPLNDGASALLLGSADAASAIGRDPVARVAGRGAHALDPQEFGFAPVEAANTALRRARISWADGLPSAQPRMTSSRISQISSVITPDVATISPSTRKLLTTDPGRSRAILKSP